MNHPDTLSPDPAAPPAAEPAFLARARRILGGDVRPDDYLPVTPEVQAGVDLDLAFLAEHVRKQFEAGRIPEAFGVHPATAVRQRNDRLLSFHHGGQNVACLEDENGVIVLAVGLEQGRAILDAFPYEVRKDVGFGSPEPDTY